MTVVKFPEKELTPDDVHEISIDIADSLDRALEGAIFIERHFMENGGDSFSMNRLINIIQESFYQVEDMLGVTHD